jgi:hypothetical protein
MSSRTGRLLLLGALGGSLLVLGSCATTRFQNLGIDQLLARDGDPGQVLVFGSAAGDVNSFEIDTSDGRRYLVSQFANAGGVRLFFFLDTPRDFTITRVTTESAQEQFQVRPDLHVTWRGRRGDGWVNSSSLYLGRFELRFKDPRVFTAVAGTVRTSFLEEDAQLLREALASRMIDARPLAPRNRLTPLLP